MAMLKRPRYGTSKRKIGSVTVLVYERDDDLGKGIAISAYEQNRERRRYDLFPNAAHMHVWSEPGQPRRYFPAGLEVAAYAELAIADLVAWRASTADLAIWIRGEVAQRLATPPADSGRSA